MAESHLYFIENPRADLIKIGVALHVEGRLQQLECSCGEGLTLRAVLPEGARFEKMLHDAFRADRARGEWFRPSPDLLSLIEHPSEIPEFVQLHMPAFEAEGRAWSRALAEAKQRDEEAAEKVRAAERAAEVERQQIAWQERNAALLVDPAEQAAQKAAYRKTREATARRQRDRNGAFAGQRGLAR